MGASFFVHGAVRVPKLQKFATGLSSQFDGTLLAGFPATVAAYSIPLLEVAIGLTILIGWKLSRYGLAAGILLMGLVMMGTCILEKWELLPSQIIHAVAFYLLLISPHCRDKIVTT